MLESGKEKKTGAIEEAGDQISAMQADSLAELVLQQAYRDNAQAVFPDLTTTVKQPDTACRAIGGQALAGPSEKGQADLLLADQGWATWAQQTTSGIKDRLSGCGPSTPSSAVISWAGQTCSGGSSSWSRPRRQGCWLGRQTQV